MSSSPFKTKPTKEAYYVQLKNADKSPIFVDVSAQLGKKPTFNSPLATCMMRVREEVILFSTMNLWKAMKQTLLETPLVLRPGPLAQLERKAASANTDELDTSRILVEVEDQTYTLSIKRDENGVAQLETEGDDEPSIELPSRPVNVTFYLRSPRNNRLVVAGWKGFQNKPGTPETIVRLASTVLTHLTGLAPFSMISGITTVRVPAPPGRYQVITPKRAPEDRVKKVVPVMFWPTDNSEAIQGSVTFEVDLDHANPSTGRLLFNSTPSKELAEVFNSFKADFEQGVNNKYIEHLGSDELSELVYNLVLGELGSGDIGRLREAAEKITGFHVSPGHAPREMGVETV